MRKEGFITNDGYKLARPIDSRSTHPYGLPKLHKLSCPLRSVMFANKTIGYSLGKMLTNRSSHLRNNPFIFKDSFNFIKKIHGSKNVDKMMVSFDVTSLFSNVPFTDRIDHVLEQMYLTYSSSCLHLLRTIQSLNVSVRLILLRITTSETHFTIDNKVYDQHNGVSMGTPLVPVIADIFMGRLEPLLMDKLMEASVYEWCQYVDGTFVFIDFKVANISDVFYRFLIVFIRP